MCLMMTSELSQVKCTYGTITPQRSAVNKLIHLLIALKSCAKEELDKLIGGKSIAPVDEPTDWNSWIVV